MGARAGVLLRQFPDAPTVGVDELDPIVSHPCRILGGVQAGAPAPGGDAGSSASERDGACCCRRRRSTSHNPSRNRAMRAKQPITIPAIAPPESPELPPLETTSFSESTLVGDASESVADGSALDVELGMGVELLDELDELLLVVVLLVKLVEEVEVLLLVVVDEQSEALIEELKPAFAKSCPSQEEPCIHFSTTFWAWSGPSLHRTSGSATCSCSRQANAHCGTARFPIFRHDVKGTDETAGKVGSWARAMP